MIGIRPARQTPRARSRRALSCDPLRLYAIRVHCTRVRTPPCRKHGQHGTAVDSSRGQAAYGIPKENVVAGQRSTDRIARRVCASTEIASRSAGEWRCVLFFRSLSSLCAETNVVVPILYMYLVTAVPAVCRRRCNELNSPEYRAYGVLGPGGRRGRGDTMEISR